MSSVGSIASSGLRAAQLQMDSSAHNVANASTPGFKAQTVTQQAEPDLGGVQSSVGRAAGTGTSLESEAVNQIQALYSFSANLQVLRTQDRMMGSLVDTKA